MNKKKWIKEKTELFKDVVWRISYVEPIEALANIPARRDKTTNRRIAEEFSQIKAENNGVPMFRQISKIPLS